MSRMKSFLGLPDANEKVLRLAKIMTILGPLANLTFVLSSSTPTPQNQLLRPIRDFLQPRTYP